jgi:uncharacterized membrane protein YbhN (UPF0104 family)/membrane-associated phospholipid phosphatase
MSGAGRFTRVPPVTSAPVVSDAPRFGVMASDAELWERRPGDGARVVVGALGAAAVGMWAQTASTLDTNVAVVVNGLGNGLEGVADALVALGTLWAVAVVVVALLALRQPRVALGVGLAGVGGWAVASLVGSWLGPHSIAGVHLVLRTGDGPEYPAVAVAVVAAIAASLAPHVIRPVRRLLALLVILVAFATIYQGVAFPSDAIGGVMVGLAAGALALVAFGAPGGRPSRGDVRRAMEELGFAVADVRAAPVSRARASVMDVTLTSGDTLRVDAFGRDQRDGQLAARMWHAAMYREPARPVFGSRIQQVEHIAYVLLLAARAGVAVPALVRTGVAGPDAALLVTRPPAGRPLAALGDAVTDPILAGAWRELGALHDAGIAHGAPDADHVFVADDGTVQLVDLDLAIVGADTWRDRDVATLLAATAAAVGNERAIAAAIGALGADRLAPAIPVIQPATVPRAALADPKHATKALKQLRADVTAATGAEDVAPLKVKRLTLVNVGMLAGVLLALAIAIPGLEGVDWATVSDEFSHAVWGWAVLALILYPLVPASWATALLGCVNADLPFVPTVLVQLACSFLNLITPNGIGGTALQLDYLHHQDVPVASAASAMVLSTGVGGAIQVVLFLAAAALTATQVSTGSSGDSVTLGAIAIGAAVIGIVLGIPKIRGKVVPAVKRAASDIYAVLRNPRKGAQLFGGDLAGNLIYPALLGLCLLAFGHSLGFAQLVVVQVGAGMMGNVAPVPGGIGVQEAALTAGLTAFGVPAAPALATVIVFRGITFALPPVFGFFTLHWLRRQGYA